MTPDDTAAEEAVKAFESKFKSKTGHKWSGNQSSYPGGAAGKYTVIYESFKGGQEKKLEAAVQSGSVLQAPKYAEPEVGAIFKHFLNETAASARQTDGRACRR